MARAQNLRTGQRSNAASLALLALALLISFAATHPVEFVASRTDTAPQYLNVVGTIPLPNDLLEDRIVVFFDDEILLPKAADGTTSVPCTVSPELPGTFRVGSHFVEFRPGSVPRDQLIEVTLNPEIRSTSGKRLNPRHRRLGFASFVFQPKQVWPIEDLSERTVLGIRFPVPVEESALKNALIVRRHEGTTVPHSLRHVSDRKIYNVILDKQDEWPVEIVARSGLRDASGYLTLPTDWIYTYPVTSALRVSGARWGGQRGDELDLQINFTKFIDAQELERHLTIQDVSTSSPTSYKILSSGRQYRHTVSLQPADLKKVAICLTIAKGLPGADRAVLKDDYVRRLYYTVPPLRIDRVYWYSRQKDGLVLDLRLNKSVDLQELKAHLQFTPEVPNIRVEPRSSNRYWVYGDWRSDCMYGIQITAGVTSSDGDTLEDPILRRNKSGTVPQYLGFNHEGKYYFPRQDDMSLGLTSRNIESVDLSLYRMFPSNIAVALSDMNDGRGSVAFQHSWSQQIGTTTTQVAKRPDRIVSTPVALEKLLPGDKRGVFCLDAIGSNGSRASKIMLLTGIGALAHWQDDEIVLFVHDVYSLAPLDLATVRVYSTKNQLLGQANSDRQGIAVLKNLDTSLGVPRVAVLEKNDDYTFLELKPRPHPKQAFDGLTSEYDADRYDAFLYADRDLYRPGETVHLQWIVRTNYCNALSGVPLVVAVVKPNGRELLSRPTVLSVFGTGGLDLETQKEYPTGLYTATLSVPGSATPIGTYRFSLEEFVPNRMKAALQLRDTLWIGNREHPIVLTAQHLFGAPAKERKCELNVYLKRGGFKTKNWKEYHFDNDSRHSPGSISCGQRVTGSDGTATFSLVYHAPPEVSFPMRATVVGAVYELGGRRVTTHAEGMVFPSDTCLGIAVAAGADEDTLAVMAAAIHPDETPADITTVSITLEKQVWNYYVRRHYTHYEPNWSESFQEIETREVGLKAGKGATSFPMKGYGYYRVRVHSPKTPQYSTYSCYWYRGRYQVADSARASLIRITHEKNRYEVGEEAEVRIESPFDGQGIVVLEADAIHKMLPVTITDGEGRVRFRVTRDMHPNVWAEATVVHAVEKERQQVYPFSSFAVTNLKVHDPENHLKIAFLSLPEEIRPATATEFEIEVRRADGIASKSELTLAAVDEGIYAIKGYESPDPYGWLCRRRRPDCRRAHYYDKVAYDFEKPAAGGGGPGGAAGRIGQRIAAVGENWIRPVALWSGTVRTDDQGRAAVKMDIPEFNGQLRLVAVACNEKAVGSHSANVLVRRPYMLRTSMPRFLLPGDRARCRAVLFNQTASAVTARISWASSGTLRGGTGSRQFEVAPNSEVDLSAEFVAGKGIGQGHIRWEAEISDASGKRLERLAEQAPIPVRPPASFQSHYEWVVLKPAESRTFRNVRFLDDERAELELVVGADPQLRIQEALKYVVGYPHGCVEQTTSRLMPLYLLRKSSSMVKVAFGDDVLLDDYIRAGIDRLFSMQTPSGGLGYWPGARNPYPYGSVYALHFLTLVKKDREIPLPKAHFEALQKYVRRLANDWNDVSPSGLYRRTYAVYVLALDGDLEALEQVKRFDALTVPTSSRYLLAAALAQNTKDKDRVRMYLSSTPSEAFSTRERGGTLNSDIRNTAVELLALRQIDGDPADIHKRANRLIRFLEDHRYGNTQETAFIVTALAEYLSEQAQHMDQAMAVVTGPNGTRDVRGRDVYHASHTGQGVEFTVRNTGTVETFVTVTTRGVPETVELAAVTEGISVDRRFAVLQADPEDKTVLRRGESYVVDVSIACTENLQNVIVSDLLPAGFEIENPRLATTALPDKQLPAAVPPSHLEIRDDRLVLAFNYLNKGTRHFYYVVNVVTPGEYVYPPVQAECMYDASVHGSSKPSTIEIQ